MFSQEETSHFDFWDSVQAGEEHYSSTVEAKVKEQIKLGDITYEVEIIYDSAEKQIYSLLYRNNHLVSSQYVYIVSSEKDFGLNYQLQQILKREKENLTASWKLREVINQQGTAQEHNSLGLFFLDKGLDHEAAEQFENALKKSPPLSDTYKNLSLVYLRKGVPHKALELLEAGVKLNPTFADLRNALGWVYLECQKRKEALEQFTMALELNKNYAEVFLNLTLWYLQESANHPENSQALTQAVKYLKKALSLDSEFTLPQEQISEWEEISKLYLILKNRVAQRDTSHIKSVCELFFSRFSYDRENVSQASWQYFLMELNEKIEDGYDFPDLRNYLGMGYWYYSFFFLEKSHNILKSDKFGKKLKNLASLNLEVVDTLNKQLEKLQPRWER